VGSIPITRFFRCLRLVSRYSQFQLNKSPDPNPD
jgi:hypothetical protein